MKNMLHFLQDFIKNKGIWVMSSLLISKAALFFTQLIIIHLLPKESFGNVVYFVSIMSFFLPILGLGTYQGLLRFSSATEIETEKWNLTRYSFQFGFLFQILVTCSFILVCVWLAHERENANIIIAFLTFRLLFFFVLQVLQSHYRAFNDNTTFSKLTIYVNVLGFVLAVLLTYLFSTIGYIISLGIAPIIVLIFVRRKMIFGNRTFTVCSLSEFWKFNINASLAWFISDLVFVLDIVLAERFVSDDVIAEYKTLILLPFNLWILPQIFIQTDYPTLCNRYLDKNYIYKYIRNYTKLFLLIGIPIVIVSYVLRNEIVPLVFGNQYFGGIHFFYLVVVVVYSWFTKTIFSNLISAIGKVQYNTITGIVSVLVLVISSLILVPKFNLQGLVWSSCFSLLSSCLLSVIFFYTNYRNILKNKV